MRRIDEVEAAEPPIDAGMQYHEPRLDPLIDRLPNGAQAVTRWLRRPSSRWVRIPAGLLLTGGGFLSVLPLFGLWMLPLGLLLLSEDVPPLRRARLHVLDWLERRRPQWFQGHRQPDEKSDHRSSDCTDKSLSTSSHL
jgi:hypothetical protein